MGENQSKQLGDGAITFLAVWYSSALLIVSGLSAHVAAVGLTQFSLHEPLLIALVATAIFAAVSFVCAPPQSTTTLNSVRPLMLQLLAGAFTLLAVGAGVCLVKSVFGTGANFYCEPLVPWRIEIALFGSFVVGFATILSSAHQRARVVYPLTMVALFWIAPFYGFFSAPLFLGISLNSMCPDRSSVTTLLAALGMIAGEQAGLRLAGWISSDSSIKDRK